MLLSTVAILDLWSRGSAVGYLLSDTRCQLDFLYYKPNFNDKHTNCKVTMDRTRSLTQAGGDLDGIN